jgi:hypothetical protein
VDKQEGTDVQLVCALLPDRNRRLMTQRRKADKEKKQTEGMTSKSNKTYTTTVAEKKIKNPQKTIFTPDRRKLNLNKSKDFSSDFVCGNKYGGRLFC